MFNLLISGDPSYGTWRESGTYRIECSRAKEYCDQDEHSRRYVDDLAARKELPCLFSYEGFYGYGRVGHLLSISVRGPYVTIAYSLDPRFPPIPIHDAETYEKLGCSDWEVNRTHWAVKNIDLFETVAELLASRVPDMGVGARMDEIWGDRSRDSARIFLSHRAKDRKSASEVAQGLRQFGHRTFVAHEDTRATREWRDEILHALSTMTHFVGLVSDEFHEGSWTDQEIGYAFAREGVKRMFIKLSVDDPRGLAGFEQAAASTWGEVIGCICELMGPN